MSSSLAVCLHLTARVAPDTGSNVDGIQLQVYGGEDPAHFGPSWNQDQCKGAAAGLQTCFFLLPANRLSDKLIFACSDYVWQCFMGHFVFPPLGGVLPWASLSSAGEAGVGCTEAAL